MFKCPDCEDKSNSLEDLLAHLEEEHSDSIPKDFTVAQYYYYKRTGKSQGKCIVCKGKTPWKEYAGKYQRLCGDPKCKEKYVATFRKNMLGKYGKVSLLNDAEHQKKMLANRSISGKYKWSDGKEIGYTGSYELDFLRFLDEFMGFDSDDIIAPSPHTYYYIYEGKKHFYFPDFFIPSLNLEVEIKEGSKNPNRHHKIQAVDKVKEKLKDDVVSSQKVFSYIKIYDKQYESFFDLLMEMKSNLKEDGEPKQLIYTRDYNEHLSVVSESSDMKDIVMESYLTLRNSNDVESLMESLDILTSDEDSKVLQNELGIRIENKIHALESNSSILNTIAMIDREYGFDHQFTPSFVEEMAFGISRVGFVSPDTGNYFDTFLREGDQTAFRNSILRKAKLMSTEESSIDGFKRDLEAIKYYSFKLGQSYPELEDMMYENYCWIDNVITEQAVTISGEQMEAVYVLLTHTGTLLSNAVKSATKKEYSHASIAFDPALDNMYSFGRKYKNNPLIGTFVKEDIGAGLFEMVKEKASYALYVTFVTPEQKQLMMDRLAYFQENASSMKYSFAGLINYKMGKESARSDAFFCSQFVDHILSSGKQYFDRHSSLVEPLDFAEHRDFHFVAKGTLNEYDAEYCNKKTELIASKIKKIKENKSQVAYIGLTQSDLKSKSVELKPEDNKLVTLPTTYKALLSLVNSNMENNNVLFYTVVPLTRLGSFKRLDDDVVIIKKPINIKVTNVNKI